MSDNAVVIVGNLGDDPDLRYTGAGAAVCNLSVAVNRGYKKDDEWVNETVWVKVQAWRELAENAAESFSKGDRVIVHGRLNENEWEDRDGNKRRTTEVVAEEIGASLKWATARITHIEKKERGE